MGAPQLPQTPWLHVWLLQWRTVCFQMVDDWLSTAATSSALNSTLGDITETAADGPRWRFLPLVAVPLWILVGNSLVLLAVVRQRSLRTLSNSVIASLAFADFLLAVLVVPLGVYQLVSALLSSNHCYHQHQHHKTVYFAASIATVCDGSNTHTHTHLRLDSRIDE